MSTGAVDSVPVAEELFEFAEDVALIGGRCDGCGAHSFPRATHCRNPECVGGAVTRTLFGRRGSLYSYTVQAYRPPPVFAMDDWAPYALGLVQLPEGLRVLAMLSGPVDDLRIGMPLELVVESLRTDEAGREVLTYKYRPETTT